MGSLGMAFEGIAVNDLLVTASAVVVLAPFDLAFHAIGGLLGFPHNVVNGVWRSIVQGLVDLS
ncbi:MAG: hypothetical protein FWE39_00535 [Nocardiaceae bacterium]|nr:hypothetical protein [Nocardiaceae bacterium]